MCWEMAASTHGDKFGIRRQLAEPFLEPFPPWLQHGPESAAAGRGEDHLVAALMNSIMAEMPVLKRSASVSSVTC